MRFSVWPNPAQSFEDVLGLARHAEATSWDGLWYADHFMPDGPDTSAPWPEAWTTLSALAASVPRIRLGPLVTGNTYRHPAVLAKMAATVDRISGGRVVLGGIAVATAVQTGADPRPFVMAVAFGGCCAFASPVAYQTHLIVYGPGCYRFTDFTRVGLPLDLICAAVGLALIPIIWPL